MEKEILSKWNEILEHFKNENYASTVSFKTWISPLKLYSVDEENNLATIIVHDNDVGTMGLSHISKKYTIFLQTSIEEVTGYHLNISYVNESEILPKEEKPIIDKVKNKTLLSNNLNEKYTFDTFITGKNNTLAHAAALAVAENPLSSEYNPLYIYGDSGLGKTHLIQSVAHYIIDNFPELNVLYTSSTDYVNEIVEAMRNSKQDRTVLTNIKNKYRGVDVLIIDDIQFIIGKTSSQEEFFQTFNALYEQGKQIILTSDKSPNQMDQLDERYKSRFNWGLPIDITSPDYETRLAILKEKNDYNEIKLNEDILKYLAENIKSNIRDLEGAYNKLIFRSKLQHFTIDLETAKEDIKDLVLTDEKQKLTNDFIINVIIEHYGITLEQITSRNRNKKLANVRQICMYMCRTYTNSSYEEIGKLLNKDRTTIMHGCEKIETEMISDAQLKRDIEILASFINA